MLELTGELCYLPHHLTNTNTTITTKDCFLEHDEILERFYYYN